MTNASRRWIALLLLAMFGFSHVSLALADCPIERASLAQAIAHAADNPCCNSIADAGYESLYGNRCVAHCTSDLRLAGSAPTLLRAPADTPVLAVAQIEAGSLAPPQLDAPPPPTITSRILLHSFLI